MAFIYNPNKFSPIIIYDFGDITPPPWANSYTTMATGWKASQPNYTLNVLGKANFTSGAYSNNLLLATTGDVFNVSGALDSKLNQNQGASPHNQWFQFIIGPVTYTNMGAAQTFFGNSSAYVTKIDLSLFTGVSLVVNKVGTAGFANSFLFLGYRDTFSTTPATYAPLVDSHPKTHIDIQNTIIDSGWFPITNTAKDVVYLALLASGGNGTLDPILGNIVAYFK